MITSNGQNPKFTCSIGRPYADAMDHLKTRWSFKDRRLFSRKICEATIIYGNLEGSENGKTILLLLDKLCDNLKYDILPKNIVNQHIDLLISSYLELSGVVVNDYGQSLGKISNSSDPSINKESAIMKNVNSDNNLFYIDNDIFNNLDTE